MARKSNNYDFLSQIESDLSGEIRDLKTLSSKINSQLKHEESTRNGLQHYLDVGIEGLKKTNELLNELLGTRSMFGCTTCIVFGIVLIVIMALSLL